MSLRNRSVSIPIAAMVCGLAMFLWTGSADAGEPVDVTVVRTGWWSERPGTTPAGEGAFEVSTGPDGAVQAVAAFEVQIAAGQVDNADIVLAESAALAEFGALKLCTTADDWEPADPGELGDAPVPDCTVSVNLTRTLDSQTWLGNITPLVATGGTTTIMVVPEYAPPPPTPIGLGMFVRIASIEITAEGSAAAEPVTSTTLDFTTPGGGNTFDPSPDSGLPGSFDPDTSFSGGGASFDPGTSGSGGIDDLGTGAADPGVAEPIASDDGFFTLGEVEEAPAESKPWVRLLLIIPLSAAIGYGTVRAKAILEDRTPDFAGV